MAKPLKKRVYEDACGTAHALELVGDRWALLIFRVLLLGPKRFGDLRAGLPGISANVLTQRLEELEANAVVVRRKRPPPASAWVYALTPWGQEAEEIVKVIGRWAARSPSHDPSLPISVSSTIMSMRTMFAPERAKDVAGTLGFRLGPEEFMATIGKGKLSIIRGEAAGADVVVTGNQQALAGAIYGGAPLSALEKAGALKIEGDRALFERYIGLFPLPQKAPDAKALGSSA